MAFGASFKRCLLASVAAGLAAGATPAFAAAAAASDTDRHVDSTKPVTVEDLVVTANRREQSLFNVPAPVTAVTGETLRTFGIADMKSVMNLVPNAVLPKSPDNYVMYINIRGIQQTDVQAQPNFGIYRNGIYAGGERPNPGPLIDVERVEITAGPQAGLYGRDAVGGAINVVYATPSQARHGYFLADYGRYNRIDLQGAGNIPISDTFALRAAGWYQDQSKGRMYDALQHTYVDRNRHDGGRLSALWTPTDNFSALWMAEYSENQGPSVQAFAPRGIQNLLVKSPPETSDLIYRNTPNVNHNNQLYLSQDLNYRGDFGRFEWLASYSKYRMHDIEDNDKTGLDPTTGPTTSSVLQRHENVRNEYTELLWFSPEHKRLTGIAGISYFDQKFGFARLYTNTLDLNQFGGPNGAAACARYLGDPTCPGVPGGAFPAIGLQSAQFGAPVDGTTIGTKSFSIFGQVKYDLTDELSVTATLRYTDDKEDLNFHQAPLAAVSPGSAYIVALYAHTFPDITLIKSFKYSKVSPEIEVEYKPSDTINLYALYSTGFRAGGFNTVTTSAQFIPYGSETAENYEAGVKTRWLDGRLGLNLDAFWMNQHHLLTYQPDPIAPPEFFFYYLNNVGAAHTYGVEFQAQAAITDWWNASASVGWEKGNLTAGSSYGYPLAGQNLELTRTWTVNLQSHARYPLGNGYDLIAGANWRYEAGGYLDITSIPWPESNRLDGILGVGHGGATLVAYMNNAFDSRPPQFVYGNGATTLVDGRTYGIRFEYRY